MLGANFFKRLSRGPQVVLPKDAGAVIAYSGLQGGDRVVDAGAGSGWLTVRLASLVAPAGKVFSYEWREDFAKLAQKNVEKAGLQAVVEVKLKSIFDGIDEQEIDLVCLDLAGSEKALAHAFAALKPGGVVVGFLPNVEQAKAFVLEGEALGFLHERTIDVLEREWLVRPHGVRPATTGLMHTVFLSFLRKPVQK